MHLKKFNVLKNWDYHDSSAPLNLRLSNIFFLGMVWPNYDTYEFIAD